MAAKLKVIVVDDEQSIRETFQWFLEDLGHDVVTFSSAEHCEVFVKDRCGKPEPCCDAILLDYNMPGLTGLEVLESMFKGGCLLDKGNAILMSGDTSKIDMTKAGMLGCRVVEKPLTLDFLETWLGEVTERQSAR